MNYDAPENPSFDDAIRALELIWSYYIIEGKAKSVALKARVSREGILGIVQPLFGTPEQELKRQIPTIVEEFRCRDETAGKLKSVLKSYAAS